MLGRAYDAILSGRYVIKKKNSEMQKFCTKTSTYKTLKMAF